jgi:hypothetical protein
LRGGHKKKNHEGFMHTSPTKTAKERLQIHHKKSTKKRLQKSPKWENMRDNKRP